MPRVFIVNEPLRADGTPAIDVGPAREYGEIAFVFPPGRPSLDQRDAGDVLEEEMGTYRATDYLLPVGHAALICAAAAYAAAKTGGSLNVLVWDNRDHRYTCFRLRLWGHGDGRSRRETENPDECTA